MTDITKMPIQQKLEPIFTSVFNAAPDGMVKAPGRINLIGEHTDYNGGFVLPCALDITTISMFRVRKDKTVRVHSLQYPEYIDHFELVQEIPASGQRWANYVRGVFHIAREYGFRLDYGLDLLISSNIPTDAGLASSAALATSVAGSIGKSLNLPLDKRSLALIAQKAENDFLGKRCGIMDQLTAIMARPDHLLLIDCEDFSVHQVPLMKELSIVVFNSCVKKNLTGNEYNNLRLECERAATIMGVKSLRHATLDILYSFKDRMNDVTFRRAKHVISENERVRRVANFLENSNISSVYKLMCDSHESMKNDFEITVPEIDALVEFCHDTLGDNVGVRMTGGGFGGPVIALCQHEQVNLLSETVAHKYYEEFKINAPVYMCRPAIGIQISWLNKRNIQ